MSRPGGCRPQGPSLERRGTRWGKRQWLQRVSQACGSAGPWGRGGSEVRQLGCPLVDKELASKAPCSFSTRTVGVPPSIPQSFCKRRYHPWPRCMSGFGAPRAEVCFRLAAVAWPALLRHRGSEESVVSSLYQLMRALSENCFSRILENLAWRRKGRRQLSKSFQLK